MRIFEIIADSLLDTKLMEMAMARAAATQLVTNKQKIINDHLIKYLYFDDQASTHWSVELTGFIREINNIYLKPKSTRLNKKVYYDRLFEDFYGHGTNVLEDTIDDFIRKNYKFIKLSGLTIQQTWWCMKQFYEWLCPLLSEDTFRIQYKNDQSLIPNKLDQLRIQSKQII